MRNGFALALVALLLFAGCIRTNRFMFKRDQRLMNYDLEVVEEALGAPALISPSALTPLPPPERLKPTLAQIANDLRTAQPTNLTLDDALSITMVNSTVVRTFSSAGTSVGSVVASPVTSYDPAIAKAALDAALAAFDASVTASGYFNRIDQPSGSFFGPGIAESVRRNEGAASATLNKPMVTGGTASVAYNPPVGYLFLPNGTNSGFFNPQYVSNLELKLIQPLLRNAGAAYNTAPIRIAHLQTDQAAWNSKQTVMASVRSIIVAYRNLQASYSALRAINETLPLIDEMVHVQQVNFAAERVIRADVAKARGQWHLYKQQQAAAQLSIAQNELALRNLMGLPPADGRRLIPVSDPIRAPLRVQTDLLMPIAIENRPDLVSQRLNIRVRDYQRLIAANGLKPQLDITGLYRMNGIGPTLGSSLQQLTHDKFDDYQTALNFSVPLGRRQASAAVRGATLQLERERAMLRQATFAASHEIGNILRQLEFVHMQFVAADQRYSEGEEWVRGARLRYQNPLPGPEGQNWLLTALNDYLMALQFRASALTEAAALLARYNGLMAQLDESLGKILASNNIEMINDPLRLARALDSPYNRLDAPDPGSMNYASDRLSKPQAVKTSPPAPAREEQRGAQPAQPALVPPGKSPATEELPAPRPEAAPANR